MAIGLVAALSILMGGSSTFPALADEHKDKDGSYEIPYNCYKYDEENDGHSEYDYHFKDGKYHVYCYLVEHYDHNENDDNDW